MGKSFVRVVQELEVKIFGQCFFSILHAKLQASTTNRTLGGDHECGRCEKMRGCRYAGWKLVKGGAAPHNAKQGEKGWGDRKTEDGGRRTGVRGTGVRGAGELGDISPLDLRSRNLKATTSLAT